MHRSIYQAVRDRDPAAASRRMMEHLVDAERLQKAEFGPLLGVDSAELATTSRSSS